MSGVSVEQLAKVVGTTTERLLSQLADAGVPKKNDADVVSDTEKLQLLDHLRKVHGKQEREQKPVNKITLRRKRTSEIKVGGKGSKTVNVEVRGKRTYVKRSQTADEEAKRAAAMAEERVKREAQAAELERKRLEAEQAKQAEEALKKEKEAADRRAQEEAEIKAKEEAERQAREKEEALQAEEKRKSEEAKKEQPKEESAEPSSKKSQPKAKAPTDEALSESAKSKKSKKKPRFDKSDDAYDTRYGREELHVARGKAGKRKKDVRSGNKGGDIAFDAPKKHGFEKPTAPIVREVKIPEAITVAELANKMSLKAADVIKKMMGMGEMVTINQVIDQDTALLVVEELGHVGISSSGEDVEIGLEEAIRNTADQGSEITRPPIVTVMGHVDHGKTSLLDYIRSTKVTSDEAGGITQHIGAYHVDTEEGTITFLDTPGHSAFTAMRARGAKITDLVVLVVAADDGVMPQTIEAIQHAQAAEVPIIVAVNKIDKPEADPDRVKNELSNHGIIPEDWGGDAQIVHVSAHTGEGVQNLLESILLQSELLELKAASSGDATGIVVEAALEVGRGPVATVLVQSGELKQGDILVCGAEYGRVRAMFDEDGKQVKVAGPSIPVQVLGLTGVPHAGDEMLVAKNERKAKELAGLRKEKSRHKRLSGLQAAKLDDFFAQSSADQKENLNVVIKADVQGSFEALNDSLQKISTEDITIKVIGGGVGGINESDAQLAIASDAILIGFNVRADASARKVLNEAEHEVHYFSVIYDAIDYIKAVGSNMLSPEIKERIIGLAEVKDVFRSSKFGAVAGSMVVDGVVKRKNPIRVLRDNVVIFEGELESLRRFKDDVDEVRMGTECGIAVRNYKDVKVGDHIEVFEHTEIARTL